MRVQVVAGLLFPRGLRRRLAQLLKWDVVCTRMYFHCMLVLGAYTHYTYSLIAMSHAVGRVGVNWVCTWAIICVSR